MKLSRYETIQLYTAGTVEIPDDFDQAGELAIISDGIALLNKNESHLQVVHRVDPNLTITYMLPSASVAAILLKKDKKERFDLHDPSKWLLGPELADNTKQQQLQFPGTEEIARLGKVFVKADTQVLVQAVTKMAAMDIGTIPDEPFRGQKERKTEKLPDPGGDKCC